MREIVQKRLDQLNVGAIEAAVAAGMERTFIRDLVEDRKKSVRSDKLAHLARALKLDAQALARGELVPADDQGQDMEAAEIMSIMSRLPEAGRDELLGRARSLEMKHRADAQPEGVPEGRPSKDAK